MVNQCDEVIGYVMFSRFQLEGKYEDELYTRMLFQYLKTLEKTQILGIQSHF